MRVFQVTDTEEGNGAVSSSAQITVHMLLYWRGRSSELVYRRIGVQRVVQPMSGCGTGLFPVSHVVLLSLVLSDERGTKTVGLE